VVSDSCDHIIPRSIRPDLVLVRSNCRGVCQSCNSRRGNRLVVEQKSPRRSRRRSSRSSTRIGKRCKAIRKPKFEHLPRSGAIFLARNVRSQRLREVFTHGVLFYAKTVVSQSNSCIRMCSGTGRKPPEAALFTPELTGRTSKPKPGGCPTSN